MSAPPFDLIQLSSLPQTSWKGRAVFHPLEQHGDVPIWKDIDENPAQPLYDVGVVLEWEPDPDFGDIGIIRVAFIMSNGSILRYGSDNLWAPNI